MRPNQQHGERRDSGQVTLVAADTLGVAERGQIGDSSLPDPMLVRRDLANGVSCSHDIVAIDWSTARS